MDYVYYVRMMRSCKLLILYQLAGADGNGNIIYEEIGMSRRPVQPADRLNLAELPHQYSVLTAPSAQNELVNMETVSQIQFGLM